MPFCDLHIHSTFSDGTYSPAEIIDISRERGLSAISITDHDAIMGISPAKAYGEEHDIMVLSGVELSTLYKDIEIHVLGYLFNEEAAEFNKRLDEMREYRKTRAKKIIEKLESHGLSITFEAVKNLAGQGAIGRPHIAQALVESNCILEYKDAFTQYIGNGKPCNVPKFDINPAEAIELIEGAGGIPVLSHPGNIGDEVVVQELLSFPFKGIEVWHPDHSSGQIERFLGFSRKKGLLTTGGSDSHGERRTKAPIGGIKVDAKVVDALIEYKQTHL